MPREQREAYEKEDIQYSRISEAMEEKRQEGRAKGLAEGKAEGLAEGEAKGEAQKAHQVALKMLAKKFDDETIIECSGLTADELAELKKSSNA